MIFFASDNCNYYTCVMLPRHVWFVARPGSKVKSGGYFSVPTNIHQNKIICLSETLIFQGLKLLFSLLLSMRAYQITNWFIHEQHVHMLTDTSNCFRRISFGPSTQRHPSQALHSWPSFYFSAYGKKVVDGKNAFQLNGEEDSTF